MHGARPPITTDTDPLKDLLDALDRTTGGSATIRLDRRRYGKAVTLIDGLADRPDRDEIAALLKARLGTGGAVKEGRIELQGDQRARVAPLLRDRGIDIRTE
jgi:translation initiation factor 1